MDTLRTSFEYLSRLGLGQPALKMYDWFGGLQSYNVDESVRNYEGTQDKGVVLLPMIPGYASWVYRCGVFAHAFRVRGYKPIVLTCSHNLDFCPSGSLSGDNLLSREMCTYYSESMMDAFGIDTVSVDELLGKEYDPTDATFDEDDLTYQGIDLSDTVLFSTRRYLRKYRVDPSNPTHSDIFRMFFYKGVELVDACKEIFRRHDVSAVIVNEWSYVQGAVPLLTAESQDVPGYTHGQAYENEHLVFGSNDNRSPVFTYADKSLVESVLAHPLSEDEAENIDRIMHERTRGERGISFVGDSSSTIASDESLTIGIFTNLIWDAAVNPTGGTFEDVHRWLDETVSNALSNPETQYILKPHPAEAVRDTNSTVTDYLKDSHDLPDNFELLSPDTDVNPYKMMEDIDAGIVYSSTIGLEMAYYGVPVVVAGGTHYRGFDFTYDPDTADEYQRLLSTPFELNMTQEMRDRAQRYAHFLFTKKQLPFPYYRRKDEGIEYDLLKVSHEKISKSEHFDMIVDRMVKNRPVLDMTDEELESLLA